MEHVDNLENIQTEETTMPWSPQNISRRKRMQPEGSRGGTNREMGGVQQDLNSPLGKGIESIQISRVPSTATSD
jgi:hypothetical protein